MRKMSFSYALDHLQLLLTQRQLFIIIFIMQCSPSRRIIIALYEIIETVSLLCLTQKLEALTVIPKVIFSSVPLQGNVTNCIGMCTWSATHDSQRKPDAGALHAFWILN